MNLQTAINLAFVALLFLSTCAEMGSYLPDFDGLEAEFMVDDLVKVEFVGEVNGSPGALSVSWDLDGCAIELFISGGGLTYTRVFPVQIPEELCAAEAPSEALEGTADPLGPDTPVMSDELDKLRPESGSELTTEDD